MVEWISWVQYEWDLNTSAAVKIQQSTYVKTSTDLDEDSLKTFLRNVDYNFCKNGKQSRPEKQYLPMN